MDQRSDGPVQPSSITPPKASRPPVQNQQSVEGSVKDTIESILVAFMLAFIFRAFVVEAFVIPTGSMAPTLLGAHMRFRCPDCGYRFDVNFPTSGGGDDVVIPASSGEDTVFSIFCPNCGFRIPRHSSEDPDNDAANVPVRYGDRILVLKYLYLFQEPKRWDVVVFKSPVEPAQYDYSQNYIKRLVGNPGETIMILDGDVYVGHGEAPTDFQVQTKPQRVQDALWRIVYDNDYQSRGLDRKVLDPMGAPINTDEAFRLPWKQPRGESGWNLGETRADHRVLRFSNPSGSGTLSFDPDANPNRYALTDWLAYDVTELQAVRRDSHHLASPQGDNVVSDVKLDFYYERQSGAGPLRAQVTKLKDHVFEARISPDSAALYHNGQPVAEPVALAHKSGPIHVQLINVDYRASLLIDGVEVAATTPQQYHPDLDSLLKAFRSNERPPKPEIRLIAENQDCAVSHLSLWRDIFYRNIDRSGVPVRWGSPNKVMKLNADEFFVMGDNSQVSLDARYWNAKIELPHEDLDVEDGRVPRRFMMGKAFFVYWPAGYRPIDAAPALVPNFGDMRFIH